MTTQDILLELNAARLAGEALSLIVAIDNEIKNKVNENMNIKREYDIVFEETNNETTETKIEIKGKKPYKFKTRSKVKSIRIVGNLDILKKKNALSLNLKPDKNSVDQIVSVLQTMGTDVDIVLDVINNNLVRMRLYKHNPKFYTSDTEEVETSENNEETSNNKKQKKKKSSKKESIDILDDEFITDLVFEDINDDDVFDLIDQIRQEYAFNITFQESDVLIEEINLVVDIKLDNNEKIDSLLDKYKDKSDEVVIALTIYEYLKSLGVKINYDIENVVSKETTLFIDPELFNIVYTENTEYDKIKFEKFVQTLPQKIKNTLEGMKHAIVKGIKSVADYIRTHFLDLIIIMLLIGQLMLLTIIAGTGLLALVSLPFTLLLLAI